MRQSLGNTKNAFAGIWGNHQKILNLLGKTERFIVAPLLGMVETGIIVLLHYRDTG